MDLLVSLYRLDRWREACRAPDGVVVRTAMPYERSPLARWVARRFGEKWADEACASFARQPVSCALAVRGDVLLGFACHEATLPGFFGPIGVDGLGRALAWAAFDGLRQRGYAYAIVGGASSAEFYVKNFAALPIPDSTPGAYSPAVRDGA